MIFKIKTSPFRIQLLALLLIATASLTAQTQAAHNLLQSGDMSYDAESYNSAETEYRKSIDESSSAKSHYNLGNSLYKQGNRSEEAINAFQKAATQATDPLVKSKAYHNMGNALMQAGDLKEATKAYKDALRNNPQDVDSKYNLAQAMRALRQQQQQQEQQQNQENQDSEENQDSQENQDQQENQENQQNQENQDGQENQDQQQEQEEKEQENQEGEENEQQQSQEGEQQTMNPEDLSREEALKLLQVMEAEDPKVLEKIRSKQSKGKKPDKDW